MFNKLPSISALLAAGALLVAPQVLHAADKEGGVAPTPIAEGPALDITEAKVTHHPDLGILVFEQQLAAAPGSILPTARGSMDGAPVLAYVFPTNLPSTAAGFHETEGVLALAVTSHPDFDDTPLWDEDSSGDYTDDGVIWHPHWVVLTADDRVPGGLAVKPLGKDQEGALPPTNPGMPMYMDSPGHAVVTKNNTLRVIVPTFRVKEKVSFQFDAVTAYLQVNVSDKSRPTLGVYKVYEVLSGDLSLPYKVTTAK